MIVALVIALQGLIGFGVVRHVRDLRATERLSLSFLVGLPLSSLLVIACDLCRIRLTTGGLLASFGLAAALANAGALGRTRAAWRPPRPRFRWMRPSEVILLLVIGVFVAISVWQCLSLPVIPRDATTGMDLVAKYAALEGRIASSVFTGPELRGQLSNQPYYAPFTMLMQVVYRLAGMPFGQIWLSVLFLSFLIYLYGRLRETVHPVLAAFLLLTFVTIPLMYSYTYLVATDFANAVFFGLGVIFLNDFLRRRRTAMLALSGLFMGFACWSRSETILLVLPGALLLLFGAFDGGGRRVARRIAVFLAPSILLFLVWHLIYFRLVFPDSPRLGLLGAGSQGKALSATVRGVIGFLGASDLYGTIFYLFAGVLLLNVVLFRDRSGVGLLAWIALLLIGFVVVVQLFPAAFVDSTVKRGFFKLFPIMIVYMAEGRLLADLTRRLAAFESDP